MMNTVPRPAVAALSAVVVGASFLVGSPPTDAATRARAGATCTASLVGTTVATPSPVTCTRMTLRSGGRVVLRWLPLARGESTPSAATIRRYGGVAPTAPGAPPTTIAGADAPAAPASASGGACVEGTWSIDGASLNRYLEQATGVPGNFVAASNMSITFAGGAFTGRGAIDMNPDPTGVVTGSARVAASGTYRSEAATLVFPTAATLIEIDVRVSGQRVEVPGVNATGGSSASYTCVGSALTFTLQIPGGRTATQTWTRT
jgi:hypothetical protein